jgi:ABC-type transport system substrate-binding protein
MLVTRLRHLSLLTILLLLTVVVGGFASRPDVVVRHGSASLTEQSVHAIPAPAAPGDDQALTMVGSSVLPDTLDPALLRDAESSFLARQIFRGLVKLDNDLIVQPDLAETIDVSADGLHYTFHLRNGITFHDGTPITANKVAASFNRASDPQLAGGNGTSLPAATYFSDIDGAAERLQGKAATISGIAATDESTLNITLRQPAASFLYKLTGAPSEVVDASTASGADWWHKANGSGPFEVSKVTSSRIVLKGFDDFYAGAPSLETVTILFGSAASQPLNLYEAGSIDVTDVPFYSIDRVTSPSDPLNSELTTIPQLSTGYIVMNTTVEPFDDPAVRTAIVQAFDRSKVSHVMLEDRVTLADGLVPPGILGRQWPADPIPYDLSAAHQTLTGAASYEIAPAFFGGPVAVALTQVLQRDLGIEADAMSLEWSQFSQKLTERDLPAFFLSWIADYPDPSNFLDTLFRTGSPDNYSNYSNPSVDDLLDKAAVERDPDTRAQLYLDAQQLIIDDAVLIPLYHDVAYTLIKPYVHGLTITPIGIISLEDVWLGEQ